MQKILAFLFFSTDWERHYISLQKKESGGMHKIVFNDNCLFTRET